MTVSTVLPRIVGVAAGALVLGALTFVAQGVLPEWVSSLANSPSGWALLTVLLVLAARPTLPVGAVCGLVAFVALVLGYTVAAEVAGLTYHPLFWGAVGVVTGPIVGAAGAALRDRRPLARAVGAALLAAVAMADTVYGLTVIADSTSPTYWLLVGALGLALLAVVARGLGSARLVALSVGLTAALVALGTVAYAGLNALYV